MEESFDHNKYKAEHFLNLSTKVDKHNRYSGLEDDFQITCSALMEMLEDELNTNLNWFHVANERKTKMQFDKKGNMFSAGGNLLKMKGVKKGVPDLWIMKPNSKYAGLIIELKAKYNKPNIEQHDWLDRLNQDGYLAVWVNSLDELQEVVDLYFRIPKK